MAADDQIDLDLGERPHPGAADPDLPGPFKVGAWARGWQRHLKGRPQILLLGEVFNLKRSRVQTYFDLRDAEGAAPCSIWNSDLEKLKLPEGALKDGSEVVIAGGPDYYPGSKTASPSFSFRVTYLRLAGEGDLLAQLERSRRLLESEGLFRPQKELPRPPIPKTIGVVTARSSAACADLLAGLERRGWRGTIVWADAPVQDRRAAPAIAKALRELAEVPAVEVAVVCRGGGSLTDLWAFCDESLCRTVALLRLPVISAIGHEVDRTLIDDVSAHACSTPTHAADALVAVDLRGARAELRGRGASTTRAATAAVARRAERLADCSRAPSRSIRDERRRLHQMLREIRAAATRGTDERERLARRHALVLARKGDAYSAAESAVRADLLRGAARLRRRAEAILATDTGRLAANSRTLAAHDPQRTLERGYALVADREGAPVASAAAARERGRVVVRFADDAVGAEIEETRSDGSEP